MISNELLSRRKALGLSQSELAAKLEVAPNTVARWERGERTIPNMLRLVLQTIEDEHWAAVTSDPTEHNARMQAEMRRRIAAEPCPE